MSKSSIAALAVLAASAASGVEMHIEPGRERVRPLESAAILVRPGLPQGAVVRVVERDGGWLSRPYRIPAGDAVALLYTAPARAGRYTIEARLPSQKLDVQIDVNPAAPSYRSAESITFGAESQARDFYRDLAEHYAPLVCQETWLEPKADYLARFDYDGDWRGDNNWDNLPHGSSQAYVYYAAIETATHHFLIYSFFHPRRYSDLCGGGDCHENDTTGLILTVQKDGSKYGRVQVMETLAQSTVYSYVADSRIRDSARRLSGDVKLWRNSHPIVFITAGSHGAFSATDMQRSRFSVERMEFAGAAGVTYRFGGMPARPAHPNDREVSYQLISMLEQLWPRATSREAIEARTFDEYFRYTAFGSRPIAAADEIAGAFYGRKGGANRARPFWAWQDTALLSRRLLAVGQWGLDPAYAVSTALKFPSGAPFATDYIYNPFLEGAGRRNTITALPRSLAAAQAGGGSERIALSPPAEKPKYNLKNKQGQLEFRGRVDGSLYLYIHGDQIDVEYLNGRPMDEIRYQFSQPLPAVELEEVKLEGADGRGSLRLLEWPNPGNQYTAKIRIVDEKAGASAYKFKLVWKR